MRRTRVWAENLALMIALSIMPSLNAADALSPSVDSGEKLTAKWKSLPPDEIDAVNRRHIHGLMVAAHKYAEVHGTLPPAVVPNAKVAGGKRLSGLVLLLPYLDANVLMYKEPPCFDEATIRMGKQLAASIDLTKAWDDPVNLTAAKTIVPAFLSPDSGRFRDDQGFAVTHFAFVQGSDAGTDGAFPGDKGVRFNEITDGTVNTLGIGQIASDLGPWIAEGLSTARQVYPPTPERPGSFGSRDPQRAWVRDLR
jgi:hypothetical protein